MYKFKKIEKNGKTRIALFKNGIIFMILRDCEEAEVMHLVEEEK